MKKSLSVLAAIILLLLCGCSDIQPQKKDLQTTEKYINGVWISYIELDKMAANGNFAENFGLAVNKCADFKITDIFLHVVPFCDAAYNSDIYHNRYSEDVLRSAVDICHKKGIRLHAWINPYRVRQADNNINNLSNNSLAYKWLNDDNPQNDNNVLVWEGGIHLNPASREVKQTVINVTRELCIKYKIDGIHIDDYFYPTTDENFDINSYTDYLKSTENPLLHSDFRRANVNALISGMYTAIKFINKDILFSISPAADIEKTRDAYFADIAAWCKSGCVDIIIPQLYFGYNYANERFCFDNILKEWKALTGDSATRLCVGLAFYKTGTETPADGDEWVQRDDILSRETAACVKDKSVCGQVFYSYSSLFSDNDLNTRAREKIKQVLDAEIK